VRTCNTLFLSLLSLLEVPLLPSSVLRSHATTVLSIVLPIAFLGHAGSIVKSGLVPKGLATQFCAAFGAGFFMACTVAPFDMVRTRLMNQPPDAKIYNGFVDCIVKVHSSPVSSSPLSIPHAHAHAHAHARSLVCPCTSHAAL